MSKQDFLDWGKTTHQFGWHSSMNWSFDLINEETN